MSRQETKFKVTPRPERRPKTQGRSGLKAIAVVMAVMALVGLISSAVLLCVYAFLGQSESWHVPDDLELQRRYSNQSRRVRSPSVVGEMLLEDCLLRIDPDPFLNRAPLLTLGVSFGLRLLSYLVIILGAIMTIMGRPLGPKLMLTAILVLVLHGLVEALSILFSGNTMATEFYRDLQCQYLHIIEVAKIEGEFRNPFIGFRAVDPRILKLCDLGYFVVTTLLWQVGALALACCRPLSPRRNAGPRIGESA